MQCPNCRNEIREGAAFCGSCGAAIPAAVPEPPASTPTVPPPPQTPQSPEPVVTSGQADYEREMAEYQRKQAEYEQQKAAYEAHQRQAAGQTAVMPPAAVPPSGPYAQAAPAQAAAPKKKTGLIVGIIIAVVLALGGLAIAGILVARSAFSGAMDELEAELEAPLTGGEGVTGEAPATDAPAASAGFATAEEAAAAALGDEGFGDWVTQLYEEDAESATYWAGPPNSEWVSELTVIRQGDGTWKVERIEALQFGGDVSMTPADEAEAVVIDFLVAIQEDRSDDAHALTIEPFSLDGASAAYSGGEFTSFEIVSVEEQSDGSAWVQTTETWYGTASDMWYYVVPTDAGYRISNVEVR